MRHTHTFLITVLYDDLERHRLRGRLRVLSQDGEQAFASTEELLAVLYATLQTGPAAGEGEPGAPDEPAGGR